MGLCNILNMNCCKCNIWNAGKLTTHSFTNYRSRLELYIDSLRSNHQARLNRGKLESSWLVKLTPYSPSFLLCHGFALLVCGCVFYFAPILFIVSMLELVIFMSYHRTNTWSYHHPLNWGAFSCIIHNKFSSVHGWFNQLWLLFSINYVWGSDVKYVIDAIHCSFPTVFFCQVCFYQL